MTGHPYFMYNDEIISDHLPEDMVPIQALRYGTGCFETMRSEAGCTVPAGVPFLFDHLHRMYDAIRYLTGIPDLQAIANCPPKESWVDNVKRIKSHANLQHKLCLVRFQVWIEDQNGFYIDSEPNIHRLIEIRAFNDTGGPIDLCYVPHQTISSKSRPAQLKLSNMLHYRDAFRTARSIGAHDAILQNSDGYLAETAIANLFWYKNGTVFTPSEETNILPGITRNRLLEAFRKEGIPCSEGTYTPDALEQADVAWITNSLREITPVRSISGIFPRRDPVPNQKQESSQKDATKTKQPAAHVIKRYQHHPFLHRVYELYQQVKYSTDVQ